MKSKVLLLGVVSGLLLQIACSEKQAGGPGAVVQPVPAGTVTIQYESVRAIMEAPGSVQPRNRISLSSQINGFVREMRVRAGDTVKKDQVLATLDARDAQSQKDAAQAAIDEAQAALAEARKSYQASVEMQAAAKASTELAGQTFSRYQKLSESRSVSPQELDEVRSRRNASIAELASREAMVSAAEDRIKQVEDRHLLELIAAHSMASTAETKAQARPTADTTAGTKAKKPVFEPFPIPLIAEVGSRHQVPNAVAAYHREQDDYFWGV